ncbi:MAG: FkbM family methyltransferase [Candidatus Thermoplasmatota archaeon]
MRPWLLRAFLASRRAVGHGHVTLDLAGGPVRFRATTPDEYVVGRSGYGEQRFIERAVADIPPGGVFYDVGANIGLYAIPASRRASRVIAFEPAPANADALAANAVLNKRTNIELRRVAVGETEGTMAFFVSSGGAGTQVNSLVQGVVSTYGRDPARIDIHVVTLDGLLADLPPPDVVKIDVEGAEGPVLRGAQTLLRRHAPILHVELHPGAMEQFGDSEAAIREMLESADYAVERDARGGTYKLLARPRGR